MGPVVKRLAAYFGLGLLALAVTGCETGRTDKAHAHWQMVADVNTTTKPKPSPGSEDKQGAQATAEVKGQPPVPGSPTAAGEDGNQPADDKDARPSPATERGEAAPPRVER